MYMILPLDCVRCSFGKKIDKQGEILKLTTSSDNPGLSGLTSVTVIYIVFALSLHITYNVFFAFLCSVR